MSTPTGGRPATSGGPPFSIDLHVHTGRYSQCAELVDPYRVAGAARQAGLSGVVLTEHDVFWQDEEIELLRRESPWIRIYRGIEVSARGCHLVVIGIEDAALLDRGMPPDLAVEVAHAAGAAVILAHPYRDADPSLLPPDLVDTIDAVEVASTSFTLPESLAAHRLAERHLRPKVASSDAHALSRIGWAWTDLPSLPADELALAEAIRSGQGLVVAPHPLPRE